MGRLVFIGIDDTDVLDGPGTGRVARGLVQYLESRGLGRHKGVIRHQLLVDPRIPYTSHNSAKCILFQTAESIESLRQPCVKYMAENFQPGSDPGLCICEDRQFDDEFYGYGVLAQTDYIPKSQTISLAEKWDIYLEALGGTGDGIIGALAGVSLSAGGNDGRYIHLRGIKEVGRLLIVSEVKEQTDTLSVIDEQGNIVPDSALVDNLGWLRPTRIDGQPKLKVRLESSADGNPVWQPVERKKICHEKG
ncbi:hypothetical protein ABFB09_04045 [Dehalogenimonas sp. THU2]|uniref:hypothetical protein n=1 Tax=Dehalogenimonas sp. THU2 TaxID=3151121 RepID=UPI00321847A9